MGILPDAGRIRVRYRIAFALCAIATLATLLTLVLPRHRLAMDLEQAGQLRLDRATQAALSQIEDAQRRVRQRHRSIARTPEFRANLETADVATLHALAAALVDREPSVDAVVFTNSLGGLVAAGGTPELQARIASIEWPILERPASCPEPTTRSTCTEIAGPGESTLFASRNRLVVGSSIPLFARGRFLGRASFLETQPASNFDHWSSLAGASIELVPATQPLAEFERVALSLSKFDIRVRASFDAEREALARLQTTIVSAGAIALLIAFAVTGLLTRSLVAPLREIESAAHRIRNGDRTTRLRSRRRDEFGEVADALDTMLDHLDTVKSGLERAQDIGRLGGWRIPVGGNEATVTPQLARILDLEARDDRLTIEQIVARVHPSDRSAFEDALSTCEAAGLPFDLDHHVLCTDGGERIVHTRGERVETDSGSLVVEGTIQDVTERKQTEEHIRVLAYHDVLTGLGNRRFFAEDLQRALSQGRQHLTPLAVLFLDLDDFKVVNDTLGHGVGDQLLCLVADRLREEIESLDGLAGEATVHRLGGDEFAVILPKLQDWEVIRRCAESLLRRLSSTVDLDGYDVQLSASVGIATWPDEGLDVESLLSGCDTAMYHAKVQGRGQYRFYEPTMRAASERRLRLESGLRRAINHEELEIVYQPKVNPANGRVVGFEALLRWKDRDLGTVSPEEFVAVAEETGQILALGEWVLERVARQARAWLDAGILDIPIAVNVSSLQIESDTLLDTVVEVLRESNLPPGQLELEVTESALLRIEEQAIEILTELKGSGVKLSLDDFGTGYSSLSYLRKLPIDAVKIDRCFVKDIAHDDQDRAFIESILSMARVLGLEVVVEGVEDEEQRDVLEAMGCRMIQGYFYSPGVLPERVPEIVAQGFPKTRA